MPSINVFRSINKRWRRPRAAYCQPVGEHAMCKWSVTKDHLRTDPQFSDYVPGSRLITIIKHGLGVSHTTFGPDRIKMSIFTTTSNTWYLNTSVPLRQVFTTYWLQCPSYMSRKRTHSCLQSSLHRTQGLFRYVFTWIKCNFPYCPWSKRWSHCTSIGVGYISVPGVISTHNTAVYPRHHLVRFKSKWSCLGHTIKCHIQSQCPETFSYG